MRYCTYCGMPMEDDDLFCTRCGKPVEEATEQGAGAETGAGRYAYGRGTEEAGGSYGGKNREEAYDTEEYDEEEYDEEEYGPEGGFRGASFGGPQGDWNRIILIASAVIIVVVLGVLLAMLVRPSGDKAKEDGQDAVAVYEPGQAQGETLGQGGAQPAAGEEPGAAAEPGAKGGSASGQGQDAAASENGSDPADPASSGEGQGGTPGSGQGTQAESSSQAADGQAAGAQDPAADAAGSGAQGAVAGSGDGYGWVVDEDGNEVYYAEEGEAYTDSDQTEVGGGARDSAEGGVQAQSADEQAAQEDARSADPLEEEAQGGTNALQGFSGTDDAYILPESASRYYTRSELTPLDSDTLQMAINEIYARHGRKFDTPSVRTYFESKSWYRGTVDPAVFDGNEVSYFNQYEMGNRELMAQIRAEREAAAGTGTGQ